MAETVEQRWVRRMLAVETSVLPATVAELVSRTATAFPERTALVFFNDVDEASLTYGQLHEAVCRAANVMEAVGVRKGSRVGVLLSNRLEFPIVWTALSRLGAVMVPMNTRYTAREVQYVAMDANIGHLITEADFLPIIAEMTDRPADLSDERILVCGPGGTRRTPSWGSLVSAASPHHIVAETIAPADLLNIQYTSGTTGFPKGCMLSNDYWVVLARSALAMDKEPTSRALSAQPFFYMDPQWHFLKTVLQAGTLFFPKAPSASRYASWLVRFDIEWCQFPSLALKYPPHPGGAPRLKQAFTGVSGDAYAEFMARYPAVIARDIFGMTEIGGGLALPFDAWDMAGSNTVGLPMCWRRARVCDENGEPVEVGGIGELQVAGRSILQGYWGNPDATNRAFVGDWFRTGDLARVDERGYYSIVGRIKDMIRRSGENVAAQEIEAVVRMLPQVARAAAVPVPDERRGEEIKLYVELREGGSPEELPLSRVIDHCRSQLASFKIPRYYEYINSLPLTASNKIAKHVLINAKEDLRLGAYDLVDDVTR